MTVVSNTSLPGSRQVFRVICVFHNAWLVENLLTRLSIIFPELGSKRSPSSLQLVSEVDPHCGSDRMFPGISFSTRTGRGSRRSGVIYAWIGSLDPWTGGTSQPNTLTPSHQQCFPLSIHPNSIPLARTSIWKKRGIIKGTFKGVKSGSLNVLRRSFTLLQISVALIRTGK